jgi:hypothetical protein
VSEPLHPERLTEEYKKQHKQLVVRYMLRQVGCIAELLEVDADDAWAAVSDACVARKVIAGALDAIDRGYFKDASQALRHLEEVIGCDHPDVIGLDISIRREQALTGK